MIRIAEFSEGTEVIARPTTVTRLMPLFRVLLHNDDINDVEHVVRVVSEVFSLSLEDALAITIEAHNSGVALCRTEPEEHAELHCEQLQSCSLTATMEPE